MNERFRTLLAEIVAAGVLAVVSMPEHEQKRAIAITLHFSAKTSRRIAESFWRAAIKADNYAVKVVSP